MNTDMGQNIFLCLCDRLNKSSKTTHKTNLNSSAVLVLVTARNSGSLLVCGAGSLMSDAESTPSYFRQMRSTKAKVGCGPYSRM